MIPLCDSCGSPMHFENNSFVCIYFGIEDKTKIEIKDDELIEEKNLSVLRKTSSRRNRMFTKKRDL